MKKKKRKFVAIKLSGTWRKPDLFQLFRLLKHRVSTARVTRLA